MNVVLTKEEIIEACKEWLWNKHQIQQQDSAGDPAFEVTIGSFGDHRRGVPNNVTLLFPEAVGRPYR